MGASASTSVAEISTNITNEALQSCPEVSSSNTFIMNNSTYVAPPGCEEGLTITQGASVDANCYLDSLQKTAASTVVAMDTATQSALGLSATTDVTDVETNINNITEQTCSDVSDDNTAIINNARINTCGVIVTQNGTAYDNCKINSTIDVINATAGDYVALTAGWDPVQDITDFFESYTIGSTVVSLGSSILCVALIALIAFLLLRNTGEKEIVYDSPSHSLEKELGSSIEEFQSGGGVLRRNKLLVAIAIVAGILLVLLLFSKPFKQKPLTTEKLDRYHKNIQDAYSIANIQ